MMTSHFEKPGRIIAVTMIEKDKRGKEKLIVSHGVNVITGKAVILPSEHPSDIGAVWDASIREWVLNP
ncbi:hypothetical protein [Mixta calida]|uniref:hypothetical protein n=1 Tax=Mixta calida TaxID=665913 RepID=UPI002FDCD757